MISSSKFFEKDLFTLDVTNRKEKKEKEEGYYGPWG